jgi:hypothetical protein
MAENTDDEIDIEFERIIINPMDYEKKVRNKLWHFLRDMHIHYEYEYY